MLDSILTLIVNTVAGVLAGVLLLRFWMQAVRVRPPVSLSQFIYQLTDWLVRPLRRVLPGVGGYDWASLAAVFLIALISMSINATLASSFAWQTIIWLALLCMVQWIFYGFMGMIFIDVIFSWINPQAPFAPFIRALTEPLMRPLRRIIPLVGNIDLSPLVALILLQIALRLVTELIIRLL